MNQAITLNQLIRTSPEGVASTSILAHQYLESKITKIALIAGISLLFLIGTSLALSHSHSIHALNIKADDALSGIVLTASASAFLFQIYKAHQLYRELDRPIEKNDEFKEYLLLKAADFLHQG